MKWIVGATIAAALLIVAFSLRTQIALLIHMQLAAGTRRGGQPGTRITINDVNTLAKFHPQQIAAYLESSRPAWRVIACQVLGVQSSADEDRNEWHRIAPRLARLALNEQADWPRNYAYDAITQLDSISPDDGREIIALLEQQPANPVRIRLISALASRCPELTTELQAMLFEATPDATDRDRAALVRLLAGRRPEIIAELLNGNASEKHAALAVLAGPPFASAGAAPAGPQAAGAKPMELEQTIRSRATELAIEFFDSDDPNQKAIAINYFQSFSDGGHALVERLAKEDSGSRIQILQALRRIAAAAYNANDGRFQFTKEEGDLLVSLLDDHDDQIRPEVAQVLNLGVPPDSRPGGPFVPGTGPADPRNADVFRRLLDAPNGNLDWLAMNYFSRITPFEERDIDRMIRAIRRDEEKLKEQGSTAVRTWQSHVTFNAIAQRYPNHPEVMAYALELLAKPKFDSDVVLYLLRFPEHRALVTQRVRELRSPSTQNDGTAQKASPQYELIALSILEKAIEDRDVVDATLLKEIVSDLMPKIWFVDGGPADRLDRDKIKALLDPQLVSDLERQVLRQRLGARIRHGVGANTGDPITPRMRAVPEFKDEAIAIAEPALESDDVEQRVAAFRFVVEAGILTAMIAEAAIAALDHDDSKLVIAAADLIGTLRIEEPRAIEKLHQLVDRKQPEAVRAAAIRNVVLVQPDKPETQQMLQSFANDPNLAVRSEVQRALKALDANR